MKTSFLNLIFSFVAVASAFAQSKIVITFEGKVPEKYTLLAANSGKPSSNATFKVREATPTKMFTFNINNDFEILHYLTEEGSFKIFLGANDELLVNIIDLDSVTFAGGSAKDNALFFKYQQQFKTSVDTAKARALMHAKLVDDFEINQFDTRIKQLEYARNVNMQSKALKDLLLSEAQYSYWANIFGYPVENANHQKAKFVKEIPVVMFDGFDINKSINDNYLASFSYREFIYNLVAYKAVEANKFNMFNGYEALVQHRMQAADNYVTGASLNYIKHRIMETYGLKLPPTVTKGYFEVMKKEGLEADYLNNLKEIQGEWMATKIKSRTEEAAKTSKKAPNTSSENKIDFTAVDMTGKAVSLDDFKGKVVYVDFWASWCGPCRRQFPFTKELMAQLTDAQKKKVVFLYISIDSTPEAWKRGIEQNKLNEGVNWYSEGGWNSNACQKFNIQSIPRYMLIDKNGNIADPNAKRPEQKDLILKDIIELLNQK